MSVVADSVETISEAVRSTPGRVLALAGQTKPALTGAGSDGTLALDVSGLSGILEYDPAELTLTARAATPVAEVQALLADHGQHLPADPVLAGAGSTLGGALAAGTSGPGAYCHGGLRDFILGVEFIDGRGRLIRGGGRVVKNAAGFDLPKLMVGSCGRLGVLTSLSFKVFPRPVARQTVVFGPAPLEHVVAAMVRLGRGPLIPEAVDCDASGCLLVRCGGDPETIDAQCDRVAEMVGAVRCETDGEEDAAVRWRGVSEFTWAPANTEIVRVALTVDRAVPLVKRLSGAGASTHLSLGANVAWVAWPEARGVAELDRLLIDLGLSAIRLTGVPGPTLLGVRGGGAFAARIRSALDPDHRFPEF